MSKSRLYLGDCLEVMKKIPDKSIDLAVLDPPYYSTNIKELGDNFWKTCENYLDWLKELLKANLMKLKENGALYIFHNDLNIMTDVLYFLKHKEGCFLRNHIKWNKFPTHSNFSRIIKTYGKNRNYSQTFSEDIYFITKQKDYFETIFSKIIKEKMNKLNLTKKELSSLFLSKNGNKTGWLSNKIKGTQIPTKKQWNKLCDVFKIEDNYENLLKQYFTQRYKFNQPYINFKCTIEKQKELLKPFSEVWEYQKEEIKNFYTSKPVAMLENIIKISSNENDVVLDSCMGSGTTGVAYMSLNRKFIGIEKEEKYFNIAKERIEKAEKENKGEKC